MDNHFVFEKKPVCRRNKTVHKDLDYELVSRYNFSYPEEWYCINIIL